MRVGLLFVLYFLALLFLCLFCWPLFLLRVLFGLDVVVVLSLIKGPNLLHIPFCSMDKSSLVTKVFVHFYEYGLFT